MLSKTVLAAAVAAAFSVSALPAQAADDKDLAQIRDEIRQMKAAYEARIAALEAKLEQASAPAAGIAAAPAAPAAPAAVAPPASSSRTAGSNAFNPAISLTLGGTYANFSQDPARARLQGFIPGGESGPGARSFNLGESELTLSANIDPHFSGKLTFALAPDNGAEVEEAFVETLGLASGATVRAGRSLSAIGYLNSQHAHTWDFVDAPLAYQAFLGGQFKNDGLQLRWLAPTDRFFELGAELGNGRAFPGSGRTGNGAGAASVFAHIGDDIGESSSWRAGLSYLRTHAHERAYEDFNALNAGVTNAFSGRSQMWIAEAVYKWAPGGNATQRNFKLQGEYFRRKENGELAADAGSGGYASNQSGWYLQGVYQFMPNWRTGLRYDRLSSGTPSIGLVNAGLLAAADFARLLPYQPRRTSLMLDYSPSEFSRLRLQFARDQSRPDAIDNQVFLQYIMSLGAHGAHAF